jgi:hypothetical protein
MADPEVRIKVSANTAQAKTALGQFGSKLDEVVRGVTGFSLASVGTVAAVTGVVNAVKRGVDEWQNYALSSKDASKSIGITVEDFTRLVQVADDVRLSQAGLTTALQMMAKNGIAPSIDSLAKLADELKGMNVTDRAARLSEIFGRNWKEVYKILEKGGDALRANTEAVADGLIVTGKAADEAEAYFQAVDQLNDSISELKNGALKELIPLLTGGVKTMNNVTNANRQANEWYVKLAYAIPGVGLALAALDGKFYETKAANEAALETVRQMPDAFLQLEQGAIDAGSGLDEITGSAAEAAAALRNDLVAAFGEVQSANEAWAKGAGGDIAGMLEQADLSAGDYNQALIALDGAMGTNEYTAKLQADATRKIVDEYKKTGDVDAFKESLLRLKNGGFQIMTDSVNVARVKLEELIARMKEFDGQTATAYVQLIEGKGGGTMTRKPTPPRRSGGYDPTDYDAASGANFVVPPGYPNDSYRMGLTSGERVSVTPVGQTTNMGGVNIYISGAGNPSAVAEQVKLKLASYGRQYQGV